MKIIKELLADVEERIKGAEGADAKTIGVSMIRAKYIEKLNERRKGILDATASFREMLEAWFRDEKTCSGKPHCRVEDCDLCMTCFEELKAQLSEEVKDD